MSAAFDLTSRFATGLPAPSPRFGGFPKYNFVGGHNDPERIPVEGLIEATASVLRREGSKLAMYNLGEGPQGFTGLREFVADKLNRHRGMKIGRDEVLITTGSVPISILKLTEKKVQTKVRPMTVPRSSAFHWTRMGCARTCWRRHWRG